MSEIIETKCTECDFVDELFDKICDKYDVVIAANVGQITPEDKRKIIENIFDVDRIKIEDFVLQNLNQIKIRYESQNEYCHRLAETLDEKQFRRLSEKEFKKMYYSKRELTFDPIYEDDEELTFKEDEDECKCEHKCNKFSVITGFFCCAGIASVIFIGLKIIMMIF